MKTSILLISLALAVLNLGCQSGQKEKMIYLSDISDQMIINLNLGETYQLQVNENLSTGYSWSVNTSDTCNITLISSFKRDNQPSYMDGVGGKRIYIITARDTGECSATFEHTGSGGDTLELKTLIFKVL